MKTNTFIGIAIFLICTSLNIKANNVSAGEDENIATVIRFSDHYEMAKYIEGNNMKDVYYCNDAVADEDVLLIIPTKDDIRLELFKSIVDEYGNTVPNYEMSLGRASTAQEMSFVLYFGKDRKADVIVEAVDGIGRRATWFPSLNDKGELMPNEDFSVFENKDQNKNEDNHSNKDANILQTYDTGYGVKVSNENGKIFLIINDIFKYRKQFATATIPTPLENGKYEILNLYGKCKGFFVGDVGQNINPVIAILYEDGTISTVNICEAIDYNHFLCSKQLKGFNDIVGFVSDGGGADYDQDGNKIFSYMTIYAVDRHGTSKEIELFNNPGDSYYENDNSHLIHIFENMTIVYMDYTKHRCYMGVLDMTATDKDYDNYNVSYEILLEKDLEDPSNTLIKSCKKGEFSLNRSKWDCYKIKTREGFNFGGKRGTLIKFNQIQLTR